MLSDRAVEDAARLVLAGRGGRRTKTVFNPGLPARWHHRRERNGTEKPPERKPRLRRAPARGHCARGRGACSGHRTPGSGRRGSRPRPAATTRHTGQPRPGAAGDGDGGGDRADPDRTGQRGQQPPAAAAHVQPRLDRHDGRATSSGSQPARRPRGTTATRAAMTPSALARSWVLEPAVSPPIDEDERERRPGRGVQGRGDAWRRS